MENDLAEIYRRKQKMQRVCSFFGHLFGWLLVVLIPLSIFLMVLGAQISNGSLPEKWLPPDRNLGMMLLNMVFPLHDLLPLFSLDQHDVWSIYLGTNGFLNLFWILIIFLLRRSFKEISRGGSPFDSIEIKRYLGVNICVSLLGLFQPLMLLVAAVLWVFLYFFRYGHATEQQAHHTIEVQETVLLSLAEITEQKSHQTGQHVKRVSEYSRILAEGMNLSPEQIEYVRIASMLHDVGKLMIDSTILEKPGKLTPQEYEAIKLHVRYGDQLLCTAKGNVMKTARVIARDHHERWDGAGYLAQKKGKEISLEGRIVAVADVFDALVSRRSYKEAWNPEDAYREITGQSGKQFDPEVVSVFEKKYPQILAVREQYADGLMDEKMVQTAVQQPA